MSGRDVLLQYQADELAQKLAALRRETYTATALRARLNLLAATLKSRDAYWFEAMSYATRAIEPIDALVEIDSVGQDVAWGAAHLFEREVIRPLTDLDDLEDDAPDDDGDGDGDADAD